MALVIFGPKKLPEIARQIGKALNEFRRASNEFKSQIESEISQLEVDEHRKILPPSDPPKGAIAASGFKLNRSPAPSLPRTGLRPGAVQPASEHDFEHQSEHESDHQTMTKAPDA